MGNEFNNLVKENFSKLKEMCDDNYESFIIALLCLEKGNNIENSSQINNNTIKLFDKVYDKFMDQDGFNLLNDNFDDVIKDLKIKFNDKAR